MNKISCEICMDLIPLVQDGVASEDSRQAVADHIKACPRCRALFSGEAPAQADHHHLLERLQNKLRFSFALLMFLGIFFGVSLMDSGGIFYNIIIMPVIGACGYGVYRWKALWKTPVCLFVIHGLSWTVSWLKNGAEFEWFGWFWWYCILAAFALIGITIAGLFHFAFRKEDFHESIEN